MKKLILILFLQLAFNSFAQITFEKTYFNNNSGYAAAAYADSSGYILGGMLGGQSSLYSYNLVLIRTNLYGDTIWTKIIHGINGDCLYGMTKANDGYVFMNSYSNIVTKNDIYLTKTNELGDVIWQNSIIKQNHDIGRSIIQTFDDGFIISGETNSISGINYPCPYDAYIVKTNSYGDTIFTKNYGKTNVNDYAYDVIETSDSNFVFVGNGEEYGVNKYQVYLLKLNKNGDTLWTRNIGDSLYDYGYCVKETLDKCYIITGVKNSGMPYHNSDIYLIKTDTNGNVLWEKTYDFNNSDIGENIFVLDNGYIISGETNNELLLLCIDNSGDTLWTKIIQLDNPLTQLKSIEKCSDNGYIMTGWTVNRLILLKTDSMGCIKPLIYSISGEQNVSVNDTISYSNNSIRGTTYYWFSGFGHITSGVSADKVNIYWDQTGIDTLYSVVYNECGSDTLTYIISIDSCIAPKISPIYGNFYPNIANGNEYPYYVEKIEGETPINYIWSVNIGSVICGQGTNSVTIQWLDDGVDEIKVIAENECGSDTSINSVIIIINGTNENKDSDNFGISIFPIPTNNNLYINLSSKFSSVNVEIIDVNGKQIYLSTIKSGLNTINLSNESEGMYFIKITDHNNIILKRILLTK